MAKLIKLELRRNKLTPYYTALAIISIVMTGFLYMIATITREEKVVDFMNYKNILKLHTFQLVLSLYELGLLTNQFLQQLLLQSYFLLF